MTAPTNRKRNNHLNVKKQSTIDNMRIYKIAAIGQQLRISAARYVLFYEDTN
jgi:hypothetical protein